MEEAGRPVLVHGATWILSTRLLIWNECEDSSGWRFCWLTQRRAVLHPSASSFRGNCCRVGFLGVAWALSPIKGSLPLVFAYYTSHVLPGSESKSDKVWRLAIIVGISIFIYYTPLRGGEGIVKLSKRADMHILVDRLGVLVSLLSSLIDYIEGLGLFALLEGIPFNLAFSFIVFCRTQECIGQVFASETAYFCFTGGLTESLGWMHAECTSVDESCMNLRFFTILGG